MEILCERERELIIFKFCPCFSLFFCLGMENRLPQYCVVGRLARELGTPEVKLRRSQFSLLHTTKWRRATYKENS